MTPPRCAWCGSVEWISQGDGRWICQQCGCSPEEAQGKASKAVLDQAATRAAQDKHDRRRRELDRRAGLVIAATAGHPMPERIRAAKLLLWQYLHLSPEEWDKRLAIWRESMAAPAGRVS